MKTDLDLNVVLVEPERLFEGDGSTGGQAENGICPLRPGQSVGLEIDLEAADLDQPLNLLGLALPCSRRLPPIITECCIEGRVLTNDLGLWL